MVEAREARVIHLQRHPGGVAAGLRTSLRSGRHEIVSAGADPSLAFIGGDPFQTAVNTGLLVPSTPTATLAAVNPNLPPSQFRYLMMLQREQFNSGEKGVRLVGIRQYAEMIARIAGVDGAPDRVFHKEIIHPLFRPPDGSISWHVMVIPKTQMARRNVANADSLVFRDSYGPALLFETVTGPASAPTAYKPPNGGRPWGKPIGASLGNIHDLRYRWRSDYAETVLDIPLPLPCDVALFASVRQNDPTKNPTDSGLTTNQFEALDDEEQFLASFAASAQYGRIAGSLVFDENLGEDVP